MGRLGSLFGYQEFGVEPDVMTLAKGLGYGVPIGAFLSKAHCQALVPGDHGSTFGGNALTTAAAFAGTQYLIENDIPGHAKEMEGALLGALNDLKSRFSFVSEVRGKGLLAAMDFESDMSGQVLANANEAGLLLNAPRPHPAAERPPAPHYSFHAAAQRDQGGDRRGGGTVGQRALEHLGLAHGVRKRCQRERSMSSLRGTKTVS
jgi:acetylornithine/succinyldiaminopimelate/putrescine aminotransferase